MKYCVVDVGGTYIKAALMDEEAKILKKWKEKSDTKSLDGFLRGLYDVIEEHLEEVDGIAISMPGKIDYKKGIAHTGGSFRFINDLNIKELLEAKYNKRVSVENDGKCAALAEKWQGVLKDTTNGLVYIMGSGIGGGLILGGNLYRGSNFCAGELSFPLVNIMDDFSFENTITAYGSTNGLLRLYEVETKKTLCGEDFFDLVLKNDEVACKVLKNFSKYIAKYILNIQAFLDLEAVAFGGGISDQDILLDYIRLEVDDLFEALSFLPTNKPKIFRCKFKNDANLIGALYNHLQKM